MKQIVIYDVVCNACVQSVRTNINTPITAHHAQKKSTQTLKCAFTTNIKVIFLEQKKMKFVCFTIFVGGRGIHQNTDSAYLLKVRVAVFYLKLLQIMLLRSKCFLTRSAPFSS